jgi:hypothetical protein
MVAVALLIGALGTVLPLPRFATERAMATETRRPLSEGATVQPAPPEPPVTDEGPVAPTSSSTKDWWWKWVSGHPLANQGPTNVPLR